jgi:hypothetical protein
LGEQLRGLDKQGKPRYELSGVEDLIGYFEPNKSSSYGYDHQRGSKKYTSLALLCAAITDSANL